jgi:2-dehydropantoate 2-reductase
MNAIPEPFNILCFGAGAIGTYIGGSLALSGCRVVFLERPEFAESLRENSLKLGLPQGERVVENPQIAASLPEALALGPFDAALLAVKSFDTPAFIAEILPYRDQIPPILCLQNGVDNEPALEAALGRDKVIPGTVTTAIGRRGAGDIKLEKLRGIGVYSGHPLSTRLVAAMEGAGLKPRAIPDAAAMKWSKMLTNLIANASSAILDMTPSEIFGDPRTFEMEIRMLRETLAVMDRKGIPVVDLPGTPVRALAWAIRYLPLAISRPLLAKAVGGGRGGKMPSFHIDLHAGRGQSEVDYLNGAVVRAGREVGVPTPVNEVLTQTLLALTSGEQSVVEYAHQPEKLIGLVGK